MGAVTTPTPAPQPGDRRTVLERPPSERYGPPRATSAEAPGGADGILVPLAIVLATAIAFVVLGGILTVTAGLVVASGFLGWLTGRLVSPPARAAVVALAAVVAGLLAIWLFGRIEGGVLDPITYLVEVEGPVVVVLCLLAGGGLAAAASR
jgi:hypothetical protein